MAESASGGSCVQPEADVFPAWMLMKDRCRAGLHDRAVTGKYKSGACIECHRASSIGGKRRERCKRGHVMAETAKTRRNAKGKLDRYCGKCSQISCTAANRRAKMAQFGLTVEAYENMLLGQAGRCAICGTTPGRTRLSVDHCHATGKVRGLLCASCNMALGMLRDDKMLFHSAIDYLIESEEPTWQRR